MSPKGQSALGENKSPQMAYRKNSKTVCFVDVETLSNVFMYSEKRKVDKVGCKRKKGVWPSP